MSETPRRKRELLAIVSILAGVFLGFTLLPLDITGPAGRFVGTAMREALGSGAPLIPVLGIVAGLAGFGLFRELELRRIAVMIAGLVFVLPFLIALVTGVTQVEDLPGSYDQWTLAHRAVGIVPAFLAWGITSIVGAAGALILGAFALSGLALYTFDWHPFRRLKPDGRKKKRKKRASKSHDPVAPEPNNPVEQLEQPATLNVAQLPTVRPRSDDPLESLDQLPPVELLRGGGDQQLGDDEDDALERLGEVLIETLGTFKVEARIVGRTTGPVVTQYEVAPAPGVKVGSIASLADDLALAMRAKSIRIVAPIPGKAAVGVEVPNPTAQIVQLRGLLETPAWLRTRATLPIPLGNNLEGRPVVADLEKMPHLLIAGATGSGKSVCINTIITGLVYRYTPRELRLLMIDPKMVELSMYNTLPHLRHPVVNDNKQAAQTLKWAIHEMQRRYELFHANQARNMSDFNRKVLAGKEVWEPEERGAGSGTSRGGSTGSGAASAVGGNADMSEAPLSLPLPYESGPLPYVVIIVDELADLMMTVQGEVEKPLAMLAQKARATGIHMVLATQRPSVNVITGLIKANFPSRIAFRVASKVDSRTILDQNGAETLLGNGDMLFLPPGKSEPIRVQGALIETEETEDLMEWYRECKAARDEELTRQGLSAPETGEQDILDLVSELEMEEAGAEKGIAAGRGDRDSLFREAAETCISNQLGSTSLLQRKLRIGYGRAARIIDQLYEAGILGPPDGSRPREVLVGLDDLDDV